MLTIRMDDCAERDQVFLLLRLALGRSASARAVKVAARLVARLEAADGGDGVIEAARASARASLELERMLSGEERGAVGLHAFVERFATLRAVAYGGSMCLRTSVVDVTVDADLARVIGYVVCDLLQVAETLEPGTPDLMLAISPDEGHMVVALAKADAEAAPVPTGEGAAALCRAEWLAGAVGGGVARGIRDGMMLFGFSVPICPGDPPRGALRYGG